MAIDPNIKKKADDIRTRKKGVEVRESLASGLEAMSTDVVETVGRQGNVESQFQDVIENTTDKDVISAPEIIAARNGEANLKARLDKEKNETTAQLAQTTTKINDYGYNVLANGAIGDGVTDDSTIINNILANSEDGDTVFIPNRKYYFKEPLYINKSITIRSVSTSEHGCEFIFDNCDGLIVNAEEIRIENIVVRGIGRVNFRQDFNIENNVFGTVGVNLTRSNVNSLRRVVTENVQVWGFSVGLGMFIGSDTIWSGAYHEFKNMVLAYNDVGVFADGMTHGKFFGGTITNNEVHGVYGRANQSYTNLDFIGTSIENNGVILPNDYTKYGVYAGDKTKIRLTNAYLENQTQFADDGGSIYYVSSHIHTTTKHFSRGSGDINSMFSFGDFITKHTFGVGFEEVANSFTPHNTEIIRTDFDYYGNAIRIKSSEGTGKIKEIRSKWQNLSARTLKAKDLEWVKISFGVKMQSGFNIEGFNFDQVLRISTVSSADGKNNELTFPSEIYNDFMDERVSFYYNPRKGGAYLNPNDYINTIGFNFIFGDGDHTLSEMIVDIIDPKIELHTKKDIAIYSDNEIIKKPVVSNVELLSDWVNRVDHDLIVTKNREGLVTLTGTIEGGIKTNGTTIAKIPSGYYPSKNIRLPSGVGSIEIRSNGNVLIIDNGFSESQAYSIHINNSFYV